MKAPALLWLLSCTLLLANGGGYFRGGVEATGSIKGFEPSNLENIQIVDELLKVSLGPESARVEIRYLLKNLTTKTTRIRFGFPVEESVDQDLFEGGGLEGINPPKSAGKIQYCRDYAVATGGDPLKVTWQGEQTPKADKRFETIAGWLISELKFRGSEEKVLRISFTSVYPEEAWSVSDDGFESASLFRYRLSTGAAWAGPIKHGRIELHPVGIDPAELRILKPVNRFHKEGQSWIWDFGNLEPTLADDLLVEAVPESRTYWRGTEDRPAVYEKRGGQWLISHSNFEVKASSTLPPEGNHQYDAKNLQDWSGVWSEGAPGNGVGEWIEVSPEVPKPLKALELSPGHNGSEALFKANARPRTVEIILNGKHRFEVDVPDSPDQLRIPVVGYEEPIRSARLVFKEVWPGRHHDDLCLSLLRLVVATDKKPEITPSR